MNPAGVPPEACVLLELNNVEVIYSDVILAVKGQKVSNSAQFYRTLWSLGSAGVDVPLTLYREGDTFDVVVVSSDRAKMLKGPRLH